MAARPSINGRTRFPSRGGKSPIAQRAFADRAVDVDVVCIVVIGFLLRFLSRYLSHCPCRCRYRYRRSRSQRSLFAQGVASMLTPAGHLSLSPDSMFPLLPAGRVYLIDKDEHLFCGASGTGRRTSLCGLLRSAISSTISKP